MLHQFIIAIGALAISKDFILSHRLWDNWKSMRWVHTASIIAMFYFGIRMFGVIVSLFSGLGSLASGDPGQLKMGFNAGFFNSDFSFFDDDIYKYLFLFCSMSLVYHFGGKTMEILYQVPYRPTFKTFIRSQARGFAFVFMCYILESVITGISSGLLSAFHIGWFQPVFKFLVQSFFFGAVIMDALHEERGWNFKASIKHSLNHYSGIALVCGTVGLALSHVPVLGALLVGSVVSVATMIAMKRIETTRF
ncbi:MAG TPA: hypothetical protein PKM27_19120 [Saprospiraceae bacterium]|nr:hypothetical protein [Saprospiraceae bacterium]HNT21654.1 hypothetical protein [Saprospiraceae bacterium]